MRIAVVLLVAVALAVAACSSPAAPAPAQPAAQQPAAKPAATLTWKWAQNTTEASPKGDLVKYWKTLIEQKTGGKVKVEMFWESALGGEAKAMEGVLQKAVEMGLASHSNFAGIVRPWSALDMPFLIEGGYGGLKKFMADSPGLVELETAAEKAGFKVVGYITEGFRHMFTTKKQVKVPDDMKGMKIRTTASPLEAAYVSAAGANPTVVDWGEIYLALKQGIVDGYPVAYSSVNNFKHTDALKFGCEYAIVPITGVIAMNLEYYNALPADIKTAMAEAKKEGTQKIIDMDMKMDGEHKAALEKGGVTIYVPSAADLGLWRQATAPVYEKHADIAPKAWVDKVRASLK